jgi:hypothetical protein
MPLRVIFRRAIRGDELVPVNPCAGSDLPANRGRRDRIVGVDTAAQVMAVLRTPFDRALWATVLYAGLRGFESLHPCCLLDAGARDYGPLMFTFPDVTLLN